MASCPAKATTGDEIMKAIPPFVANSNDDIHCVNAVFRMVLQHYLNEDLSWEQIDLATKSIPGKGTWTIGGDLLLAQCGVKVLNIEPVDYIALHHDGVEYLSRVFGEQTAVYYLTRSNIASVIPDIPEFLKHVSHETRKISTKEIISHIEKDALVGVTVNSSILNHTIGFSLHYILLYGFDGTNFLLHDPGLPPAPSRKITIEEFEKSFFYPGGNGGVEIFYGKTKI